MKWYNEDKSMMVDIDKISHYYYNKYDNTLTLFIDGHEIYLRNYEAQDIYNALISKLMFDINPTKAVI